MNQWLKGAVVAASVLTIVGLAPAPAPAQDIKFFRIGTGGTAGTYFPIGGLLANAISNAPGSRACDQGGSCGVPGLIATAMASNGSVANINGIAGKALESGFSQADVAYWAYTGTGVWEGRPKVESLRAIANLYPESIHLVARAGLGIKSPADLRGKRVSMDEPGSGTLVDARLILAAYGLSDADITPEFLKPNQSADKMKDGALDAFFFVGGYPTGAISELATSGTAIELVPITGPQADQLLAEYRFFAKDLIPAGTYKGTAETPTISVGAQWVVGAHVDEELVYGITKALWNDKNRGLLDNGHAKAKQIRTQTALAGIGVPLHPGAERFYREAGLLK